MANEAKTPTLEALSITWPEEEHLDVVDWTELWELFVSEPGTSLRAFARRHGVPRETLRRHAQREGWLRDRAGLEAARAARAGSPC